MPKKRKETLKCLQDIQKNKITFLPRITTPIPPKLEQNVKCKYKQNAVMCKSHKHTYYSQINTI